MKTIPKLNRFAFLSLHLLLGLIVIRLLLNISQVFINTSHSLDLGLYNLKKNDFYQKGDIVLLCLNNKVSQYAYKHGFIGTGNCKFNKAPVGKTIIAEPGDIVEIIDNQIYINKQHIENSDLYELQDWFISLNKSFVIKKDEFFVMNNNKLSFDSRYYGPITKDSIIGKIEKIKLSK